MRGHNMPTAQCLDEPRIAAVSHFLYLGLSRYLSQIIPVLIYGTENVRD